MKIIKFQRYLNEASFAKTLRMLRGDIPHVNRLAIMTSDNPHGRPASPEQNNATRAKFLRDVRAANYSGVGVRSSEEDLPYVIPTGGSFGSVEQSFIIPHITRDYAIELGRRYGQKAIIWGQKITENDSEFIRFEYIEHPDDDPDNYQTIQTRDVVISGSDLEGQSIADRSDFYSGRKMGKLGPNKDTKKFLVPFFDDRYKNARYSADRRRVEVPGPIPIPVSQGLRKAEVFYIPFFDDVMAGLMPIVEVFGEINFESNDLPDNDIVREVVKDIKQREEFLYRDTVGSASWGNRGGLNESLKELGKLVRSSGR